MRLSWTLQTLAASKYLLGFAESAYIAVAESPVSPRLAPVPHGEKPKKAVFAHYLVTDISHAIKENMLRLC